MATYQRFMAQVSDKSGTIGGQPLPCRSFTQAKKFLLDWLLTKAFDPVNGAPQIVAKTGVYATITHELVALDIEEEAKKTGYQLATPAQIAEPVKQLTPEKRFIAVQDGANWKLADKPMTAEEIVAAAESEAAAQQAKADTVAARARELRANATAEVNAKLDAEKKPKK